MTELKVVDHDDMGRRVEAALEVAGFVPKDSFVIYSAYRSVEGPLPRDGHWPVYDNLDEVPLQGRFRIVYKGDAYWGTGQGFESEILESPTWLELCVVAEQQIRTTGDLHHVFLEGIGRKGGTLGERDNTSRLDDGEEAELWLGS